MKLRTYQFVVQITVVESDEGIQEVIQEKENRGMGMNVMTILRNELESNLDSLAYVDNCIVMRGVVTE